VTKVWCVWQFVEVVLNCHTVILMVKQHLCDFAFETVTQITHKLIAQNNLAADILKLN